MLILKCTGCSTSREITPEQAQAYGINDWPCCTKCGCPEVVTKARIVQNEIFKRNKVKSINGNKTK